MLYIASAPALWHWWSIIIITWADGKVAPWLDPVDRHCLVSHFVWMRACVCACRRMYFCYCSFSNAVATLTWLYWQVSYANKWPRLAGSVEGDGCIWLHQVGEWWAQQIEGRNGFISLGLRPTTCPNKTHSGQVWPHIVMMVTLLNYFILLVILYYQCRCDIGSSTLLSTFFFWRSVK